MKKFLLSLATLAMMATSADAMYLIGAPAGNWSPTIGIEMEETDGGWKWSGFIGENDYFAFATQLLDSDDWATFNANYRISPDDGDGTYAATGTYSMHLGGMDGAFCGVGAQTTLLLQETNGNYTLTVTADGEAPAPTDDTWSLIGSFSDWSGDVPMTEIEPGVWSVTMDELDGEFKFRANNSWELNIGAGEYAEIDGDGEYPISFTGNNFSISEATDVTLTLDLNHNFLSVVGIDDPLPKFIALRGSFSDWEFEWQFMFMENEKGIYTLFMDGVDSEWEFKIADQTWSEQYTTQNTEMVAGEVYPLTVNDGGSLNMGTATTYMEVTWVLNLNDNTLSFTGEAIDTSVAGIEIANGSARYFNLQGAEVQNPTKGLYIRIANGKSEKILVK